MPEFEVSVRAFRHKVVEADTEQEAEQKAIQNAESDLPYEWSISDTDTEQL